VAILSAPVNFEKCAEQIYGQSNAGAYRDKLKGEVAISESLQHGAHKRKEASGRHEQARKESIRPT
jgi:hypothetical protein